MLKYVKGNLIDLALNRHFDCIVHGCNCFCTMGAGIARQIRKQFPHAYEADKATVPGDRSKLGTYTVALSKQFRIINAYTQYGFNRDNDMFEYAAFQNILDTLVKEYPGCRFGFPMIGCGLAGGDASRIIPMLENFAEKIESTGGNATLVEFV